MNKDKFPIGSTRQLKDWIKNVSVKNKIAANTVLQNYMMERFLERVSLSEYNENFILKGGFLIAAMVGIDMRSTMDLDTTIKGVPVNETELCKIITEIISVPIDDNVTFELSNIKPIHQEGEYEDFRLLIVAKFFNMRVNLKIDITTGDTIIPKEVDYSFKLMFEDRAINIKAYNLNTVLSEKIESILVRNVSNTRMRDFYDVYILLTTRKNDIDITELRFAISEKARERNTLVYIEQKDKYLADIKNSDDLKALWKAYQKKYSYADGIEYDDLIQNLRNVFEK